jgi:hypothetical protein
MVDREPRLEELHGGLDLVVIGPRDRRLGPTRKAPRTNASPGARARRGTVASTAALRHVDPLAPMAGHSCWLVTVVPL